jgi:glycogen debranching enzyme
VQDVAVNAVYAKGWRILSDLALEYNDTQSFKLFREYNSDSERAIKTYLWDKDLNRFVTRYKDQNGEWKRSNVQCIQTLLPILLQSLEGNQLNSLLEDITDPAKFWTEYPFPSVSLSEPTYTGVYRVNLMWRGPSWAFPTWMIMQGFKQHNRSDLYDIVCKRWKRLIELQNGVWEMWNARTGVGYGAQGLGMSTLYIDVI